jgi:hypothetical protein
MRSPPTTGDTKLLEAVDYESAHISETDSDEIHPGAHVTAAANTARHMTSKTTTPLPWLTPSF